MNATAMKATPRSDVHALATSIAQHLGANWSADRKGDDPTCSAGLTCSANGAQLWISVDYTGRAECSGRFPTMSNGATYSAGKADYGRVTPDTAIKVLEVLRKAKARS